MIGDKGPRLAHYPGELRGWSPGFIVGPNDNGELLVSCGMDYSDAEDASTVWYRYATTADLEAMGLVRVR